MVSMQVIDWDLAVTTGVRLVRPGPQVSREEARQAVLELRRLSRDAEGHVREFTRIDSAPPEAATVVDRPGWIRANVDGFRVVLEPLTQKMSNMPPIVGAVGSRITGLEVGAVLAFLASRVLGQYELFLPPDPSGVAPAAGSPWSRRTSCTPSASSASTRATSACGCASTRRPTGCSSPACPGCGSTCAAR